MRVVENAAWTAFDVAIEQLAGAVRLKDIRANPIVRGRATLRLFEVAPEGERPHPRLRLAFTEVSDPSPPLLPAFEQWSDPAAFRTWLIAALNDPGLTAGLQQAPAQSPHHWQNALYSARVAAMLEHARTGVEQRVDWSASERDTAKYAIAEIGALAYAGIVQFDDEDTGTYHSYLADQPFVHVLELLHASLPEEGTPAFALLPSEQQYAIRRQRTQLRNHLDFLMRNKYAYGGITETDIERSLGGFLIDRTTRQVASETLATSTSLTPRHELLRIDPASGHPHAGAWVVRTKAGLALRDGTAVDVAEDQLLHAPIPQAQLTFERAPGDPKLRAGVRFDWNGDGRVEPQPLAWVAWAGHCDVKAVLEQMGLAMLGQPTVHEYRSDTGQVGELTRDLLLELLSAVIEFGSVYEHIDGTGEIVLGIHHFGGARNDSLPDRLQFAGAGPDQYFRWPLGREREAMQTTKLEHHGQSLDLDTVFGHCIPDLANLDFSPNPRYVETVEGDQNLIDVTGMVLSVTVRVGSFDPKGQYVHEDRSLTIDLRPEATGRSFLGTHLEDPTAREIYRVYLDHEQPAAVAELWRWNQSTGKEEHVPDEDLSLPLASPVSATLAREMRLDNPSSFQALLELALRQGQNICADTDFESPVWNGVVTRLQVQRTAVNPAARVERWLAQFDARFGKASLDFMVRRASDGTPEDFCPIATPSAPDFLWQDLPDIASKGVEAGAWVVNQAMRDREIVKVRWEPTEQGGWYVEDDHVKNAFELLYAALAGYRFTIVHQNKRHVFEDEAAWLAARAKLDALREQLSFE